MLQIQGTHVPLYSKTLGNLAYYDANTDRTIISNRANAIKYVFDNYANKAGTYTNFIIRYNGGYYFNYIIMRNGAASDSSILEYSAYSNEINIWIISHATGSASIAKTFSDDDTVLKSNYEVTATESYTEDCNDITEPGLFNQVINPDAVNGPGQYAYIVVYSASHFGMITQIAIPYNINGTLKVRTRELGTWRDWRTP